MTIHAVLTVDLNGGVTTSARTKFYESLRERHFTKNKLTTMWTVRFAETATLAGAKSYVKDSVALASKASGITDYEAGAMFGESPFVQWSSAHSTLLGS